MNSKFEEAERKLKIWADDASSLISELPPSIFDGIHVQEDLVLESLLKTTDSDGAIVALLQKLFASILAVVQRQLKSQLPGGEFWEPSDLLKEQAKSCESTNISGERVFAICQTVKCFEQGQQKQDSLNPKRYLKQTRLDFG
ncbi:hypothetical protein SNE40_018274 [Patella caerulea]|uniref:Uncharacterized protein n=1 Tax=Patella caerulea TaxID=87958 RepID=A0AAN8JA49_PATCE